MWNPYGILWNPYGILWNPYEILWNPCGICGIHMDSMEGIVVDSIPFHLDSRGIFHGIFKFHGVSIWNEYGKLHQNGWALSQKNSIWNPWNPHGISIDSTWNLPGMWGHSKDLSDSSMSTLAADTLKDMANLAAIYKNLERWNEVEQLQIQVCPL